MKDNAVWLPCEGVNLRKDHLVLGKCCPFGDHAMLLKKQSISFCSFDNLCAEKNNFSKIILNGLNVPNSGNTCSLDKLARGREAGEEGLFQMTFLPSNMEVFKGKDRQGIQG